MSADQTGRNILITGGSFGLGLAMAEIFAAKGHRVVICGRSAEKLSHAEGLCPELTGIQADITRPEDRQRLFAEATKDNQPLDILINNAAVCHAHDYTNSFTLSADRAHEEIETNFAAPIELIRMYLAQREAAGETERPGTIVNVSTPGALFSLEANPLYTASKAGFHNFTISLRRHLKDTAVKVIETFPPSLATGLAVELDVEGEEANGPDVIAEVAARSVEGILNGEETILPHEQSVQLVTAFGGNFDELAAKVNVGVERRAGWDQA